VPCLSDSNRRNSFKKIAGVLRQSLLRGHHTWRRDVFGSNGFAYNCTGRIKRIHNPKPENIKRVGGDHEKIAAEVQRILDSIEVLSTNSASKP
jgi:hypothetical protein